MNHIFTQQEKTEILNKYDAFKKEEKIGTISKWGVGTIL